MEPRLMVLPAKDFERIRVVEIPEDLEGREAFRSVTGLIAQAEEESGMGWEEIGALLEDHGFVSVEFQLGPELD
jgi:hypothetical protein